MSENNEIILNLKNINKSYESTKVLENINLAIKNNEPWETLGYCWMHSFKCHSARVCYTWTAGGPVSENDISQSWQQRSDEKESKET